MPTTSVPPSQWSPTGVILANQVVIRTIPPSACRFPCNRFEAALNPLGQFDHNCNPAKHP
ncbi:hypothetical protein LZ32DRAFT_603587 [Colletotrichum eremochloae]|nr:hypothetical protein LZ32DRAFT_603587 [Colletotrichum eremochloae]